MNTRQQSIYKTNSFLAILTLSFVLRLAWVLLIPVIPQSDSFMYDAFALSISQGTGYAYPDGGLTAYWPVGTSAIYGALYYIFGHSYSVITSFNIIIGTVTTALIMLLANHWFNQKTAFFAGLIYAFWPSQIQFTTILASELIFNFFLLLGLFFWIKATTKNYLFLVLATTFFVSASYVRPIALLIPFILIALHYMKDFSLTNALKATIYVMITMAILITPWSLRNHHLFGEFVLISTNGAPVLWMGNNPNSDGGYMPLPEIEFSSEVERSHYFKKQAIDHIRAEPILFIKRSLIRLIDYYKSETIGVYWNKLGITESLGDKWLKPLKYQSTFYWSVILLTAFYGAYIYLQQTEMKKALLETPFFALIAYFTVIHMIIASGDRYHFPIIPFLAMLSGYSIVQIQKKVCSKSRL